MFRLDRTCLETRQTCINQRRVSSKPLYGRLHTAVCIASGPSLTADDCETVRNWRNISRRSTQTEKETGAQEKIVIVVNTTFELAPWADILYAMDRNWWEGYYKKNNKQFAGIRLSPLSGLTCATKIRFNHYQNSGVGAISLAAHLGAKRIILLGYDCQKTGGKTHWHGNHPKGLGNAGSIGTWPGMFERLKKDLNGIEIVNCTRETALRMFERKPLEEVLNEHNQH